MGRAKRIFTLLVAVMLFAAFFCSLGYIAENTHHTCMGTGCPVCARLEAAESIINSLGAISFFAAAVIFQFISITVCAVFYEIVCAKNTLVKLKIELLD